MNNLNINEIYFLMKGAEEQIKQRKSHIIDSKHSLKTAINNNDTEWQKIIIENIEYDTEVICTLESSIAKLKAI